MIRLSYVYLWDQWLKMFVGVFLLETTMPGSFQWCNSFVGIEYRLEDKIKEPDAMSKIRQKSRLLLRLSLHESQVYNHHNTSDSFNTGYWFPETVRIKFIYFYLLFGLLVVYMYRVKESKYNPSLYKRNLKSLFPLILYRKGT